MAKVKKLSFYEVNPRYFKDNTGNGVGDLAGLAAKFDYFDYLGVQAIILQDVLSSDGDDQIQNFTSVSKEVGDINDLSKILSIAKSNNKKIFIELNIGSITESNKWFNTVIQERSPELEDIISLYPKKEDVTANTKYSQTAKGYYVFDEKTKEIPLNWRSEQTLEQFLIVVRFWRDLGVAGFVFKNFEYLTDPSKQSILSESTLKELRKFYRAIKEVEDAIIIVGKSNIVSSDVAYKYTNGSTQVLDYFFSTQVSLIGTDLKHGNDVIGKFVPSKLAKAISIQSKSPANILSLGSSLSGRVVSRWLNDEQYVAESAKLLGLLLLVNTSSSSIYYGDELGSKNIGLTHLDNFQDKTLEERKRNAFESNISEEDFMNAQVLQNPINSRSLIAWNDLKNGGFSTSEKTITPTSVDYKEINVEAEYNDAHSALNFFKELNRLVTTSSYVKILHEGRQKVSTLFGVIRVSIKFDKKELLILANLTGGSKKIWRKPKAGKIVLSNYPHKEYLGLPKNLEAYEAILISKNTDEAIKETIQLKAFEEKERKRLIAEEQAAILAAKHEEEKKLREIEKAKEIEKRSIEKAQYEAEKEIERIKALEEKTRLIEIKKQEKEEERIKALEKKTRLIEIKKQEKEEEKEIEREVVEEHEAKKSFKSDIEIEKENQLAERLALENSKGRTILKENEIAKTTQVDVDDDEDIDKILEKFNKK